MQLKKQIFDSFKQNKTKWIIILFSFITVYIFIAAGMLSYLRNSEEITNKLPGYSGSIALYEPEWDKQGVKMAQAVEPGMTIPKNPYGYNKGESDVYIRLKMTISLKDFDTENKTDTYIDTYANAEDRDKRRLKSIIESIKWKSDNGTLVSLVDIQTDNNVSNWRITRCRNEQFITDGVNYGNDDTLVFYFYYIADNNKLQSVSQYGKTAELFQSIQIPVYKKEFLGVFDQGFNITMEAEGIPSRDYPNIGLEEANTLFLGN